MSGRFMLFDLSRRRWWLLIMIIAVVVVGGLWLQRAYRTDTDPVAGQEEQAAASEPGSVVRAMELYKSGNREAAADEFVKSFGADIVEYPEAAATAVDLLVSLSRTDDLDIVVNEVINCPVFELEYHLDGLEQMVNRLYVNNDLMRSSLVEEKLRTLVNELVNAEPDDLLLRLYQVRLWAGYLANFPQWDMVGWFAHSILMIADADFPPQLWAEIHGYYAQSLLEMWDGRDPDTARKALDSALELSPDNAWVLYLSGLLNYESGYTERARQELTQAYELMPTVDEIAIAADLSRVDIVDGELILVKEIEGTWYDLSPDGRLLAVADRGKITIHDLTDGTSYVVDRDSVTDVGHIAWSPWSDKLAYLAADKVAGEGSLFSRILMYDIKSDGEREVIGNNVFSCLEGLTWMPDGRVSVWGEPVDGTTGLYTVTVDGELQMIAAKEMVWCEDAADWGFSPQHSLWAVLMTDSGPPKTNARIWFIDDHGNKWLAVDYPDSLVWNPGSISWSVRGELAAHWAQDSWAVTPIKIVVLNTDGELEHITWGRSLDSGAAWSPDGEQLIYFTRPIGDDNWYLVVTDRNRTWEVRFDGNWRWWSLPRWQGDHIVVGTAPRQIGVFTLSTPASP